MVANVPGRYSHDELHLSPIKYLHCLLKHLKRTIRSLDELLEHTRAPIVTWPPTSSRSTPWILDKSLTTPQLITTQSIRVNKRGARRTPVAHIHAWHSPGSKASRATAARKGAMASARAYHTRAGSASTPTRSCGHARAAGSTPGARLAPTTVVHPPRPLAACAPDRCATTTWALPLQNLSKPINLSIQSLYYRWTTPLQTTCKIKLQLKNK